MVKRFIGALLLAVNLSAVAITESGPIYGYVDYPYHGQFISRSNFDHIAGWAFDCRTGYWPNAVNISFYNHETGGTWYVPPTYQFYAVPRPDVYAIYSPYCPISIYTGYHAYFEPPPPGFYRLWVVWADVPFGYHLDQAIDIHITE